MPCLYIDCIELQDIFHGRIVSTKALVFLLLLIFLTMGTSDMAHEKEALYCNLMSIFPQLSTCAHSVHAGAILLGFLETNSLGLQYKPPSEKAEVFL